MPLSASFGFFFDQTYQSRYGELGIASPPP